MRLLICTQSVDPEDPVLGFFHGWLAEFAKHFENITVVCLRSGACSLPENVEVVTLGKGFRFQRALEVCSVAFARRKDYETVFVHMNQEYVLAVGWLWKLLGKRTYMWRNHYKGNMLTDIAVAFCTKIFCTSRFSYTAKHKKTVLMPVGIDTDVFRVVSDTLRAPRSILFFGRMAPSKRPELLIEALGILHKNRSDFKATFCGPGEAEYIESLKRNVHDLGLAERVRFLAGVPNREAPRIFSEHDIYVNCSPSGMYDKTMFEAAACGCVVIAASFDWANIVGKQFIFQEESSGQLSGKLKQALTMSDKEKTSLQEKQIDIVLNEHSLMLLGEKLLKETRVY